METPISTRTAPGAAMSTARFFSSGNVSDLKSRLPAVAGNVPIAQLRAGFAALLAVNEGRLDGERQLAQWVEKCHIVGD